jgi:Ca2+-transporting ATPase
MAGGMALLLAAVLGIPGLRALRGLEWPGGQGLVVAAGLLGLCLAWLELVRRAGPFRQRRQARAPL